MASVRVVKRKWDGTVSAMDTAHPWPSQAAARPGSSGPEQSGALARARSRSSAATSCGLRFPASGGCCAATWTRPDARRLQGPCGGSLRGPARRRRGPLGRPRPGLRGLRWRGGAAGPGEFHEHARTMGYPVTSCGVPGRASRIAAKYTTGEWPFDGSMQEGSTGPDVRSLHGP